LKSRQVEINVSFEVSWLFQLVMYMLNWWLVIKECQAARPIVESLMAPARTVMDLVMFAIIPRFYVSLIFRALLLHCTLLQEARDKCEELVTQLLSHILAKPEFS